MSYKNLISAKVIADSIHRESRVTTMEVVFPRFILAEFNTHRVLSRNSASSRAIPVWRRLADVIENPVVPLHFGKNRPGMQSTEELSHEDKIAAEASWLVGRDVAVLQAFSLVGGEEQVIADSRGNEKALAVCEFIRDLALRYPDVVARLKKMSVGIHKQHANRILEPYSWHTVIVTATKWRNFYALRASKKAQPEIVELGIAMAKAHCESSPERLFDGEWHLPYIYGEDRAEVGQATIEERNKLAMISSGRCARVSYLTHYGKRSLDADLSLARGLMSDGHTSPFEHPCRTADRSGAYIGDLGGNFGSYWIQFRKTLESENDFSQLINKDDLLLGLGNDQQLFEFVLSLPE